MNFVQLIDGLKISEHLLSDIRQEVSKLSPKPMLAIVYTGQNAASEIYVNKKMEAAKSVGIETELIRLSDTDTKELLAVTKTLNGRDEITGYIAQLPLQKNIDKKTVLRSIAPEKDVDGLSPINLGRLWHGQKCLKSATALAVVECLKYVAKYADGKYEVNELEDGEALLEDYLKGKSVLIINDSLLVGKPLGAIMLTNLATVTIANKHTNERNLKKFTSRADAIITATGQPGLITSDMVHNGQVLIDVGINKTALGVGGDIDPKGLESKNVWYTPVPNGVGPITVAMLLQNTLLAYKTNILSSKHEQTKPKKN
ncbi:bifunctional methylenetetrahydrofolate dehydrogenase/methenyltetrahydrofolate cyclohydrolase [Candidatus Dojkabacteria bacterium]|nr:bifunctional methylenetetrahydrofolate dehydrogenase/methenyltetrahydrofolate cyclohydrolase [Candidatus Dojkabacteria bacterium]